MGYRLTLYHYPVQIDERSNEWRGLFSGLQVRSLLQPFKFFKLTDMFELIIDLEHASPPFTCPARSCQIKHNYHHCYNFKPLQAIRSTVLHI